MSDKIENGMVVGLHYKLTGADGAVIDSCDDEEFLYLQGGGNIVPGLEQALEGHGVGDDVAASLTAEEGYGEREGPEPQKVSREVFPEEAELEVGAYFAAEGEEGEMLDLWISKIEGDDVYIDHNHPLAGQALNFQVKVLSVRAATEEEQEHGHPHGPDDDHHH